MIKARKFETDLEFADDGRLLTVHYVIQNRKRIRITSRCDQDCPSENRLFNGRDCPGRVMCFAHNTDGHMLSKNEIGEICMRVNRAVKSTAAELDRLLGFER